MPRYIDANKIRWHTKWLFSDDKRAVAYMDEVDNIPAADVEEVKHSWLEKPTELSESVCHLCRKSPKMIFGLLPDYCPHCGAIFDGKENEND